MITHAMRNASCRRAVALLERPLTAAWRAAQREALTREGPLYHRTRRPQPKRTLPAPGPPSPTRSPAALTYIFAAPNEQFGTGNSTVKVDSEPWYEPSSARAEVGGALPGLPAARAPGDAAAGHCAARSGLYACRPHGMGSGPERAPNLVARVCLPCMRAHRAWPAGAMHDCTPRVCPARAQPAAVRSGAAHSCSLRACAQHTT